MPVCVPTEVTPLPHCWESSGVNSSAYARWHERPLWPSLGHGLWSAGQCLEEEVEGLDLRQYHWVRMPRTDEFQHVTRFDFDSVCNESLVRQLNLVRGAEVARSAVPGVPAELGYSSLESFREGLERERASHDSVCFGECENGMPAGIRRGSLCGRYRGELPVNKNIELTYSCL